jgi:hypothetical protein
MKPISPFSGAPTSAMNFPVAEYVNAFRDAGRTQLVGQQQMMQGAEQGVKYVADFIKESKDAEAKAKAMSPFFNKNTLENMFGVTGDENAAMIQQYKNASVNEKLQMGNMLVGTFLESQMKERDRQALAERQQMELGARRNEAIFKAYTEAGLAPGASAFSGGGQLPQAAPIQAAPLEGELPVEAGAPQGESLIPPIQGEAVQSARKDSFGSAATDIVAQKQEKSKQYQQALQSNLEVVNKKYEPAIMEAKKLKETSSDPYQRWLADKSIEEAEYAKLVDESNVYSEFGNKNKVTQLTPLINDQSQKINNKYSDFGKREDVKEKMAFYNSKAISDLRKNIPSINATIAQAKGYLAQGDRQKAANTIQTFIAKQGNSLTSPDALAEAERNAVSPEINNLTIKNAFSTLFNRMKNGEFTFENLTGTDIEGYLERMQDSVDAIAAAQNKMIFTEIAKPLGSYAEGRVFPISGYSFVEENSKTPNSPTSNAPQGGGIPGLEQAGATNTQNDSRNKSVPTKFRLKGRQLMQ